MLRLSKKTDYALIALTDLALRVDGSWSSAREMAKRYDVPSEVMAKILQRLVRKGILASHQGTGGGYHLAREASKISVVDVIQAIDGPVMVTACSTVDNQCVQYSKCSVRDPLWRIKDQIVSALSACTIVELAQDVSLNLTPPVSVAKDSPNTNPAVTKTRQ